MNQCLIKQFCLNTPNVYIHCRCKCNVCNIYLFIYLISKICKQFYSERLLVLNRTPKAGRKRTEKRASVWPLGDGVLRLPPDTLYPIQTLERQREEDNLHKRPCAPMSGPRGRGSRVESREERSLCASGWCSLNNKRRDYPQNPSISYGRFTKFTTVRSASVHVPATVRQFREGFSCRFI